MTTSRTMMVLAAAGAIASGRAQSQPIEPQSSAEDYDDRFIGFDDYAAIDPETGVLHKFAEPYEGRYKKPLAAPDFYRLVGREDLAQEYVSRETRQRFLMGAAAIVALGSVVATAVLALESQPGPCPLGDYAAFSACSSRQADEGRSSVLTAAAIGAGGVLIAAVLGFAAASTNPHPVD